MDAGRGDGDWGCASGSESEIVEVEGPVSVGRSGGTGDVVCRVKKGLAGGCRDEKEEEEEEDEDEAVGAKAKADEEEDVAKEEDEEGQDCCCGPRKGVRLDWLRRGTGRPAGAGTRRVLGPGDAEAGEADVIPSRIWAASGSAAALRCWESRWDTQSGRESPGN